MLRWSACLSLLGLVSACFGGEPPGDPHEPRAVPTYHKDIRPLLAQYCTSCHQADSAAPFTLTDYESAKQWAEVSAVAVMSRQMPPYLADNSGHCGDFKDALWMSEDDIRIFEDWAAAGAPEGDRTIPPPQAREIATLSGETVSVSTGAEYLPDQSASDDYRCFVVESPGSFAVTGFDVLPSNPRIAHHLIAYQVQSETAAQEAYRLADQAEGPGYPCLGTGPQVDALSIAGWAPGAGATLFPDGTGFELDGSLPIVIEMHYNTAAGLGETDETQLIFEVVEVGSVDPLFEIAAIDYDFSAPPSLPTWSTTDDLPINWSLSDFGLGGYQGDVLIHGVNGHMHGRGLSLRVQSVGQKNHCLVDIPRWDFNWQRWYWFNEPIRVSAADALRITCEFSTLGLSKPLTWGDGTNDEMCLASAYITLID